MINPQIRNYIELCRNQGIADHHIKDALLTAGWREAQINEAFAPVLPISPNYPPISAHHRLGRFLLWAITILILSSASSVVLGEYGYFPAASRLYRRVNLPLLWKGTSANPIISLGRMALNSSQEQPLTYDAKYSLTVSSASGTPKSVTLQDLPYIGSKLADLTPEPHVFANKTLSSLSDSTGQYSTILATPPNIQLPLTINATYHLSADKDRNSEMAFSIDLKKLKSSVPDLASVLADNLDTLTVNSLVFPGKHVMYAKSNGIPSLKDGDSADWFAVDIPKERVTENKNKAAKTLSGIKGEDLTKLKSILKNSVTDQGIIRRNGQALAHYKVSLDQKYLKSILGYKALDNYSYDAELLSLGNPVITGDLYIEPRSALLREANLDITMQPSGSGYKYVFSLQNKFGYGSSQTIKQPASPDINATKLGTYLSEISLRNSGSLASTGLLSKASWDELNAEISMFGGINAISQTKGQNAQRISNVSRLGTTMELYLNSSVGSAHTPPSTQNATQRLDDPSNALAGIEGFNSLLPLADPDPSNYYYAYKSDGTTYEFTCVIINEETGNVSNIYGVRNGTTFEKQI